MIWLLLVHSACLLFLLLWVARSAHQDPQDGIFHCPECHTKFVVLLRQQDEHCDDCDFLTREAWNRARAQLALSRGSRMPDLRCPECQKAFDLWHPVAPRSRS